MIDDILALYPSDPATQEIQRIQTAHRIQLVKRWGIPPGARVLEIGCGQGDTTAVLADAVGADGFVQGVDIAPPDYGAPETLGQARERLLSSPVGGRVSITLSLDILTAPAPFAEKEFDVAVLSHCLWYLDSPALLDHLLWRIKPWTKRLAIAEWDPRPVVPEQMAHYQAASIQAVCESFRKERSSNIRTLFYPREIERAVAAAGFRVEQTAAVDAPALQDGRWEAEMTAAEYPAVIRSLSGMPERLKALLLSQIEELKRVQAIRPLPVFCLTAGGI